MYVLGVHCSTLSRQTTYDPPAQHAEAAAGKFGFAVNNTIGGTPQPNPWTDDWVDFFRMHRLKHMLDLVGQAGLQRKGYQLMDRIDVLFQGISVKPSILHGDLWSGNMAAVDGAPAIFDPACYYGHHEAEFGTVFGRLRSPSSGAHTLQ